MKLRDCDGVLLGVLIWVVIAASFMLLPWVIDLMRWSYDHANLAFGYKS